LSSGNVQECQRSAHEVEKQKTIGATSDKKGKVEGDREGAMAQRGLNVKGRGMTKSKVLRRGVKK